MNMKKLILAAAVTLLASPLLADGHKSSKEGSFELGFGLGQYRFDSDWRLDDSSTKAISGAYQFSENWQAEFIWGDIDTDSDINNMSVDGDWYGLRALYLFDSGEYFTPYLSGGLGYTEVDYIGDDADKSLMVGAGIKGNFDDNWFWRLEANFHSGDASDQTLLGMIGYRFGSSSKPMPMPAKPMPPKPDMDSDKDGVMDKVDQCPGTKMGVKVNKMGCPMDSDNDGVMDYADKCPNSAPKAVVDENGCQKSLDKEVSVNLEILFDTNKSVVKDQYMSEVARVAEFMNEYRNTQVTIEGHTDSQGAEAYNKALSQRRADAVAAVLVKKYGIAANRVKSMGYGEERPIASNGTAEGRQKNRRVVAVLNEKVKVKAWK
jgi:OmpA-OmpF porin, OOP family